MLEKCEPIVRNEKREHDGFVFFIGEFGALSFQHQLKPATNSNLFSFFFRLVFVATISKSFAEFQDNLKQRLSTNTEAERNDWIQAIRQASYEEMRKKLKHLREQIEQRRDNKQDVDVDMMRLQVGKEIGDLIQF